MIPRIKIQGRTLASITLDTDLELVDLRSLSALRQAAQDTWLTMADPTDYAQTRHWGHWIRKQRPTCDGFAWQSKRDPTRTSYILFDDHHAIPTSPTPGVVPVDFDTPPGLNELRQYLNLFNADVSPDTWHRNHDRTIGLGHPTSSCGKCWSRFVNGRRRSATDHPR